MFDENTCINNCFYGVYLLCSESPMKQYKGRCYIGFTVNPNRRIKQHNRGKDFGGAKKTSNRGPWQMVMIVHGFPNNISALQFEWAWQQPSLSTRLKRFPELKRKQRNETFFQYNFRILSHMLTVGPWNRLPLTIRWLESEYECEFPFGNKPPLHMNIVSGKVILHKQLTTKASSQGTQPCPIWSRECHLCMKPIDNPDRSRIGCINNLCKLTCHIICLANYVLTSEDCNRGHYIPIKGTCPLCEETFAWAAILQKKKKLENLISEDDEDSEWDPNEDSDGEFHCNREDKEVELMSNDVYEISD